MSGSGTQDDLAAELRALREEVARLNAHRYIRIQNSVPRMLGTSKTWVSTRRMPSISLRDWAQCRAETEALE